MTVCVSWVACTTCNGVCLLLALSDVRGNAVTTVAIGLTTDKPPPESRMAMT